MAYFVGIARCALHHKIASEFLEKLKTWEKEIEHLNPGTGFAFCSKKIIKKGRKEYERC